MKLSKLLCGIALAALVAGQADAATTVFPTQSYSKDISGTVTTGGTYQTVAAANSDRKNCTIQNPSSATESLKIKLGTMAQPFEIAAGAFWSSTFGNISAIDAITVTATTTNHAFAGVCQ